MLMNSNEYLQIIETIKGQIKGAQYQAALNVNRELIMLYYHIGKVINEHKTWGSKFIENLAADIRISFPNVKGYSVRNLKYMAKFAETYPDEAFVQTVSAQIPWSHYRYFGQGKRCRSACVVHPKDNRKRVVTQRPHSSD